MSAPPWPRLREILEAALDAPDTERVGTLDRLCATIEERRAVEDLLAAEPAANGKLDAPRRASAEDLVSALEGARMVGRMAGAYRLDELIATGGMGEVYRASRDDGAFQRVVAVKLIRRSVMSPAAARRFAAERRLLARLSHPNIAALLDGGETDGRPYLVLEFVEGLALRDYCDRNAVDARGRAALMRTICSALAHAHQNLIVHRDLKPSNVIVTADGVPKLLDFGISKLLGDDAGDPTVTAARMFTPRYASPEQLRGEPVTTASDVYSLGVILHETLTGRAWGGDTGGHSRTPQFSGEVEPPSRVAPGIDREVDAIVLQALEPDPARRYPSAEAMGADLERYLAGEPVRAYAASRWYAARKWAGRHRLPIAAACAVLLVITSAAVAAAVMAARLAAERAQTVAAQRDAERVSRFLLGMIESAGDRAMGGRLTFDAFLDDAVARLDADPDEGLDAAAASGPVRLAIGRAYLNLGRAADGGAQVEAALHAMGSAHGPDDLRTVETREQWARHLMLQGEFPRAEAEYARALEARRRVQGAGHPDLARPLEGLGWSHMIRRDFDGSRRWLDQALAVCEAAGRDDRSAVVLDALGQLDLFAGRPAESVAHRERALELERRSGGSPSLRAADAIGRLGESCARAGDTARAESLLRESLTMTRQLQGETRAAASPHLIGLARLQQHRGEFDEAERTFQDEIAVLDRALPESRHDWVYLRENYAIFLIQQSRLRDARPHIEAAAQAYAELLGEAHQRTRIARETLEWIDANLGAGGPEYSPRP
ncbi:MAG: protein kinase domain-containing protein [Phycisphaerales bacterium]